MIVVRWGSFLLYVACLVCIASDVREWLIAGLSLVAFVIFIGTMGAFRGLVADIDESDPDALTAREQRDIDREGTRS